MTRRHRRVHVIVWGLGVIVLIAVVVMALGSGGRDGSGGLRTESPTESLTDSRAGLAGGFVCGGVS